MEGKTHSSKSYAVEGAVSYMASDLARCSANFLSSYRERDISRHGAKNEGGKQPSVCITGAGLAGLRCAQILVQAGIDVTVCEARDRVGGRVCQELLNGTLVDMGPNWVHGTDSNPIVRLFGETKTQTRKLGEDSVYVASDGKPIDEERVERVDAIIWEIIGEAFAYSNKSCTEIAPELSLKDWFEQKLPERGLSDEHHDLALQMAQLWGSFIGDSWQEQSLKWFWLEECLDGENLFVVDSHKALVEKLADGLMPHINLNTRVTSVESTYEEDGQDPSQRVMMVRNGEQQVREFDEVIVTVPLACLKRETIKFLPDLRLNIRMAITNVTVSSLEKVYLTFPEAFWDKQSNSRDQADDEADKDDSKPLPGFTNFLNPISYAPPEHQTWCLELNPLSNPEHFGEHAQPALLFSIFGDCGQALSSRINRLSPTSQEYFDTINDFFRPYYSRLPNYSSSDQRCTPTAILATNWQNDEFAYGSYTNFKVHLPQRDVKIDDAVRTMRYGIPERGLWIAGEHTAPFVGLGTSTGAYWSGEMAAMRVLGAYGLAGRVVGK